MPSKARLKKIGPRESEHVFIDGFRNPLVRSHFNMFMDSAEKTPVIHSSPFQKVHST